MLRVGDIVRHKNDFLRLKVNATPGSCQGCYFDGNCKSRYSESCYMKKFVKIDISRIEPKAGSILEARENVFLKVGSQTCHSCSINNEEDWGMCLGTRVGMCDGFSSREIINLEKKYYKSKDNS